MKSIRSSNFTFFVSGLQLILSGYNFASGDIETGTVCILGCAFSLFMALRMRKSA